MINVPAGTININNDLVIQSDITVIGASARTNDHRRRPQVPRVPGHVDRQREDQPPHDPQRRRRARAARPTAAAS